MKFSRVILLAAAMSAMVFAQDDDDYDDNAGRGFTASPTPTFSASPARADGNTSPSSSAGRGRVKMRVSGDVDINSGFEFENNYSHRREIRRDSDNNPVLDRDGNTVFDTIKVDEWSREFNIMYHWNLRFGFDFGEKVSADFRFSNPSGYGGDNLNGWMEIWEGTQSAEGVNRWFQGYIPAIPNAYITLRPTSRFSFYGGLLEVKGNTVLDLVAGAEGILLEEDINAGGLWTNYSNWNAEYNSSQAGVKLGVGFSDNLAVNFSILAPTARDFRFILDTDIGLGDAITLTPVIALRSFNNMPYTYTPIGEEEEIERNPVLFAIGADLGLALSDAFNLDFGIALGNVKLGMWEAENNIPGTSSYEGKGRETLFGFLMKIAPLINFGMNEIAFQYSLGVGSFTERSDEEVNEVGAGGGSHSERFTFSSVYNDLFFGWNFRLSEHFAFGPNVAMAFRKDSFKERYDSSLPRDWGEPTSADDVTNNKLTGFNHIRLGLGFTANF